MVDVSPQNGLRSAAYVRTESTRYGITDVKDLFEPCWRRIERADGHRKRLSEVWNAHIDTHLYHFELIHEGDGVGQKFA